MTNYIIPANPRHTEPIQIVRIDDCYGISITKVFVNVHFKSRKVKDSSWMPPRNLAVGFNPTKTVDIALIFKTYGKFVMERGIFGGFMNFQTTIRSEDFSQFFSSEEDSRRCFEAVVSEKASGFGFKGSFSAEASGCSEDESSYSQETATQNVVGWDILNGEFIVSPKLSTLLNTKNKYPSGDNGIQLRLLTDCLAPDKISPLEVKRLLLTEDDFSEIEQNLEQHLLAELQEVGHIVDEQCDGDCDLPYLEYENGALACKCYRPLPPDQGM